MFKRMHPPGERDNRRRTVTRRLSRMINDDDVNRSYSLCERQNKNNTRVKTFFFRYNV